MKMTSTWALVERRSKIIPFFMYDDYSCSKNCHLQKHSKAWQKYSCFILLVLHMEFFIIFLWILNLVSSVLKFCNIYLVISTLIVVDWGIVHD